MEEFEGMSVQGMYEQKLPTSQIAEIVASRAGKDIEKLRADFDDVDIINYFGERVGPTVERAAEMKPDRMDIGGEQLYELRREYDMSTPDLAKYVANMMGKDYEKLTSPQTIVRDGKEVTVGPFTDEQIIARYTQARDVSTAQAVGEGTLRGTTMGAGAVAGGMAGAPLGPWGVVGGAVLGGLGADVFGSFMRPERPIQNVPYEFGMSLGTNLTLAPVPNVVNKMLATEGRDVLLERALSQFADTFRKNNGMAKLGPRTTPFERVLQSAAERPLATAGVESLAGLSAAGFGATAEREAPGQPLPRVTAETLGGISTPVTVSKIIAPAFDAVREAISPASQQGVKGVVTNARVMSIQRKLLPLLEDMGEDPQKLLATLREINSPEFVDDIAKMAKEQGIDLGPRFTAALTENPVLAMVQAQATKGMAPGPTLERATQQNLAGLSKLVDVLYATDDPALMSAAGKLQEAQFEAINQSIVDMSVARQLDTAEKLVTRQGDVMQAGKVLDTALTSSLMIARETEGKLYGAVDRTAPASADNTIAEYDRLVNDELLPESPLPPFIRKFVARVSGRDQVSGTTEAEGTVSTLNRQITSLDNETRKLQKKWDGYKDLGEVWDTYFQAIRGTEAQAEQPKDLDRAIRALSNIAADYRGKGADRIGSYLDSTTRNRVAQMAETQIKIYRNQQERAALTSERDTLQTSIQEMASEVEAPEISLNDLMKFRSEMLSYAKDARAAGNFRDARLYSRMSDAALDDLGVRASTIEERIANGEQISENEKALVRAYQYSRSLNDVFTRSFAGDLLARSDTGARKVAPELIGDVVNGGSANATNLKINQIREAALFAAQNAGEDAAETAAANVDTTTAALETILRSDASRLVNPDTKELNLGNMAAFLQNNEETLKLFPGLKADLENATTAQKLLTDSQDASSKLRQALDDEIAFTFFVGADERPSMRLGNAIGDPAKWAAGTGPETPVKNFDALARVARQGADQYSARVMDGFKRVIMDHAVTYSGLRDGDLSFVALKDYFVKPMNGRQGGENMLGLIKKHQIMDETELVNLNKILNQGAFIESQIKKGVPTDQIISDAPAEAFDLVLRLGGSTLGQRLATMIPGRGGSQDLVAAGAGVRFARNTFLNMPTQYFDNMVLEAIKDPRAMEMILAATPKNTNQRLRLQSQMNGWLYASGFAPEASKASDELRLTTMRYQAQQQRGLDRAAEARAIESFLQSANQPTPMVEAPAPVPAPPAVPTPAEVNMAPTAAPPVARSTPPQSMPPSSNLYPVLFPNDPISSLLATRGPR